MVENEASELMLAPTMDQCGREAGKKQEPNWKAGPHQQQNQKTQTHNSIVAQGGSAA